MTDSQAKCEPEPEPASLCVGNPPTSRECASARDFGTGAARRQVVSEAGSSSQTSSVSLPAFSTRSSEYSHERREPAAGQRQRYNCPISSRAAHRSSHVAAPTKRQRSGDPRQEDSSSSTGASDAHRRIAHRIVKRAHVLVEGPASASLARVGRFDTASRLSAFVKQHRTSPADEPGSLPSTPFSTSHRHPSPSLSPSFSRGDTAAGPGVVDVNARQSVNWVLPAGFAIAPTARTSLPSARANAILRQMRAYQKRFPRH